MQITPTTPMIQIGIPDVSDGADVEVVDSDAEAVTAAVALMTGVSDAGGAAVVTVAAGTVVPAGAVPVSVGIIPAVAVPDGDTTATGVAAVAGRVVATGAAAVAVAATVGAVVVSFVWPDCSAEVSMGTALPETGATAATIRIRRHSVTRIKTVRSLILVT